MKHSSTTLFIILFTLTLHFVTPQTGQLPPDFVVNIAVREFLPMATCPIGDSISGAELTSATSEKASEWGGFDVDMIKSIAILAPWNNWNLHCVSLQDLKEGVLDGTYFMGIGGIPITSEDMRNGYDFSLPEYTAGLKLAVRNDSKRGLWSFLLSFDASLWIMIVVTTFITGLLAWMFEEQKIRLTRDKRCRRNLFEMIWQAFCSLFYTSEIRLQKFSSRVIFLCFWFMVLVLTATYTADLTTKLATRTPKGQFLNMKEAGKANIKIAYYDEARYKEIIFKKDDPDLNEDAYEIDPENAKAFPFTADGLKDIECSFVCPKDNEQFVEHDLSRIDGILIDVPVADHLKSKYTCDVFVTEDTLQNFNYGFIYSAETDRDYIWNIDITLFQVKESSDMQTLIKRHILVSPDTTYSGCLNETNVLALAQLGGLWIIIAFCLFIGFISEVIYFFYERRQERKLIEKQEQFKKEGKVFKKKSAEILKREKFQDILHSYLMVTDYIHIPSKNIHLHVEDDIKRNIDKIENIMKERFLDMERRVNGYLSKISELNDLVENSDGLAESVSFNESDLDNVTEDQSEPSQIDLNNDVDEKFVYANDEHTGTRE